ncbi:MAG: hypothetical protein WGN25_17285 [Candidatus Electrothrix sp. GW3-4]|uniref:hypothetical protein n=1 Tax=Candidatus Electrothrix sp. GW3-4 TaxID=3126740 RepID=UPI0030CD8840
MSNTATQECKEVIVAPLAAGREVLGLTVVICCIFLLAGLRYGQVAPKDEVVAKKSYQMQDIRLKNQAPVLYRSLLGAVDSITWTYESLGNWPEISELQTESLPPFVGDFLPAGLRGFSWEMHQGKTWVDYYGANKEVAQQEKQGADPLENSFILRIIDLQAGQYPYPFVQGSQEDRFSAQIWINPQIVDYSEGPLVERGWKWVVSGNAAVNGKVTESSGS